MIKIATFLCGIGAVYIAVLEPVASMTANYINWLASLP